MLARAFVPMLVALLGCKQEPRREPVADHTTTATNTAAPAISFDDVPPLPSSSSRVTKPVLPVDLAGKLPAEVTATRRETIVNLGFDVPPVARAAIAAHYYCEGPPFARFAGSGTAFYGSRVIADTLLDVPKLRASLECGRVAARATQWTTYVLQMNSRSGATVRLFPEPLGPVLWPGFQAPAHTPEGLLRLGCRPLIGGDCLAGGSAVGTVGRLGLDGLGPLGLLLPLTRSDALWLGADAPRIPNVTEDDTSSHDVSMTPRLGDTGFFEIAISPEGEGAHVEGAREQLVQALRDTNGFVVDATPSGYWGNETFAVRVPRPGEAHGVEVALDNLRKTLVAEPAPRIETPTLDAELDDIIRRSTRQSLGTAMVVTSRDGLELRAKLELDPSLRTRFDELLAARQEGLAALDRVLRAALAGSDPTPDDLSTLGGPTLVSDLASRRRREHRVVPSEPPPGFPKLLIPTGGRPSIEMPVVRYERGGEDLVDDALDLLEDIGFHVRPARLWTKGPSFIAARGDERYWLSFVRTSSGAVDLVLRGP